VVITDGFTGNVAMKSAEGVADFVFTQLRETLTSKLHYKLAALVLRPALLQMRRRMDPGEYGGAPMLGVNGVVVITHGRADPHGIKNAIRSARDAVASGMVDAIHGALGHRLHALER
jgi:glycerol-3-phosphate acyltransferase PlsX